MRGARRPTEAPSPTQFAKSVNGIRPNPSHCPSMAVMNARPAPGTRPDTGRVCVVVLSRAEDTADAVNRLLRRAGLTAQVTRVADGADLETAVESRRPELVVIAADDRLFPVEAIAGLRARQWPAPSVLLLLGECSEAASETALASGAQDIISLGAPKRLVLVAQREIEAQRTARALSAATAISRDTERALAALREGSTDAIAEVAEGIVVAANPAWLALLGYSELGSIEGLPVMDCFDPLSHAALKGALSACLEGRWPAEPLRLRARHADGSARPIDIVLALGATREGEAVISLRVPVNSGDTVDDLRSQLDRAIRTDPTTRFLHRAHLLDSLVERCRAPVSGGVRYLAAVQIDHPEQVADQVGPLAAEGLIALLADELRCHVAPHDLGGRFTGSSLVFLVERGTTADVEHWAAQIIRAVSGRAFALSGRSIGITLTIGLARVMAADADDAMARAMAAVRQGRTEGGNRCCVRDPSPQTMNEEDRVWVQRIKSALMDNRFRLQQQPIASLTGQAADSYDLLVRLQDDDGSDVLPSEFLAAAQRHDLLRALDRWVLAASIALAAQRAGKAFFVRISADTLNDRTIVAWLRNQISALGIEPGRLVIQIPEADIDRAPDAAIALRHGLEAAGIRLAIEHLGFGQDSLQLLGTLKPDFVKIDGKLMQGLAQHPEQQATVRAIVMQAHTTGTATIAERVEDSNTMAVLFALGVESIQGRFVQKSEAVVLG